MRTSLGRKIHRLRKEKGLTLEALGREAGSSKAYVWELENRETSRPSAEKINAIARALGVTAEFLLDEAVDEPSTDVADAAFFRRYQVLPADTKAKIQQIMELLESEPKK